MYKKFCFEYKKLNITRDRTKQGTYNEGVEWNQQIKDIIDDFLCECSKIIQNKYELCNALIDLVYSTEYSRHFLWVLCADEIVEVLSERYGTIHLIIQDDDCGVIDFAGHSYKDVVRDYRSKKNENIA